MPTQPPTRITPHTTTSSVRIAGLHFAWSGEPIRLPLDTPSAKQLPTHSGAILRSGLIRTTPFVTGAFMPSTLNPATTADHHRFHFLDGLRGVAAIIVVALHPPPEVRQHLTTYSGHLAVDFFFALSGFVIAFSYEQRLRDSLSWPSFAVARLIRLYPMIFLGTLIGLIAVALNRVSPNYIHMVLPVPLEFWHALLSFSILPAIFFARPKDLLYPIDPPMWSLFFEFAANFVFAAMVRLRVAANVVLVPLWIAALFALEYERRLHGSFDFGYTVEGLAEGFARVAVSFLAGVFVCRLYRRLQLLRIHGAAAVISALALTAIFLYILCDASRITVPTLTGFVEIALIFPAILFFGAHLSLPTAATKLCSLLGDISYPLYLIHDPLMWPLYCTRVRSYFAHSVLATPVDFATIAVLIAIAWWVSRVYDAPVRKWLNTTLRSSQKRNHLTTTHPV
jgi:peptidoglycan/LPS O-acetylase OafA/YrhL